MRTPVIAAMNGWAAGMGVTLPTQWDVRFGAADAKYGFVFTRRGIVPELSSTWMLPRLIGLSRAMELLLSGRYFSGTEAAEMGLFSRALPAEEVLPAALEFARDLAANTSAVSVAATKALVYQAFGERIPLPPTTGSGTWSAGWGSGPIHARPSRRSWRSGRRSGSCPRSRTTRRTCKRAGPGHRVGRANRPPGPGRAAPRPRRGPADR